MTIFDLILVWAIIRDCLVFRCCSSAAARAKVEGEGGEDDTWEEVQLPLALLMLGSTEEGPLPVQDRV
jgi:hypothetical protein